VRDFPYPSRPALGPTQSPIQWVPGFFPAVKWSGRGVDHPPAYSAEIKERVELYLYFPSGPSWPVLGWSLPFPLPHQSILTIINSPSLLYVFLFWFNYTPRFVSFWNSKDVTGQFTEKCVTFEYLSSSARRRSSQSRSLKFAFDPVTTAHVSSFVPSVAPHNTCYRVCLPSAPAVIPSSTFVQFQSAAFCLSEVKQRNLQKICHCIEYNEPTNAHLYNKTLI
jgi:hypothetical protein